MSPKQKFQIGFMAVVGILFIAAGAYSVRDRIPFLNRASELKMCMPKSVICDLPYNEAVSGSYKLILKDATGKVLKEGIFGDVGGKIEYSYDAGVDLSTLNLSRYTCVAQYIGADTDDDLLQCNGLVTEENLCSVIPTPTPKQCQCADGSLDCMGGIYTENYKKEDQPHPGLIRLNPRYTGPQCFACKKIVVTDSEGTKEEYDCTGYPKEPNGLLLPTPTVIRLHQAKGSQCMQYSISLIGESGEVPNTTTQTCGSCTKEICCPTCAQPFVLPDAAGNPSCGQQCSYSFVGFPAQCPLAGDTVKLSVPITASGTYCFSTDKFGSPGKEICKTFSVSEVPTTWTPSIPYPDAGVYDLKLECPNRLVLPAEPLVTTGQVTPCTQRFSIGCGPNTVTPPGGGGGDLPKTPTPLTGTPTVTPPSPTPTGMCPWTASELNVRMKCPNCANQ